MVKLVTQLRTIINASLDAFEAELEASQLPELTFEPTPHPLDDATLVPSPKLFESRRVAVSALQMLVGLIKPAWQTASYEGPYSAGIVGAYCVAADNLIANILAEEGVDPKVGLHVDVLAERTKVDGGKLARCLRLLVGECVFTETSENVFANNRISLALIGPSNAHGWAMLASKYLSKGQLSIPEHLKDAEGRTALALAFNETLDFWGSVYADPDRTKWFITGMGGCGAMSIAGLLNDYPYEKLGEGHLVDVAGGMGAMSLPIIAKHPKLKLTIQDLDNVIPVSKENFAANWSSIDASRVNFQVFDCFKSNPIAGENVTYMMRWILHDWPDADCVKILKALREPMHAKSKILIMDISITPAIPSKTSFEEYSQSFASVDNSAPYAPLQLPSPLPINGASAARGEGLMDMAMMACFVSQERTPEHLKQLLLQADLELVKIYYTRGSLHIAECQVKGATA